MTKFDLKDAYFMIPMAPHHKCLLRFQWKGKTYKFNCLPFGLLSVLWVFSKTISTDNNLYLWSLGLRVIIYIDNKLIKANSLMW